MIWTLRVSFLLFLAWAIFMVSPFVALYSLAKAVEARDVALIRERVNFPALRISLTKQLVSDYLLAAGRGKALDGFDRQVASGIGATLADPLVAELVTPEALIDLLEDGRPQGAGGAGGDEGGFTLDTSSLRQALSLFVKSETRGFRNISIPVPPDESADRGFRLHLRLSGTTWRLIGIDLPEHLRRELVDRLPRGKAS